MFHAIQGAWDARDETALGTLVGNDLLVEWHRRLGDFARKGWHNRVRVISGPEVRYVGLTNRERDEEDRIVVHICATLEDYVEGPGGMRVMHEGTTHDDHRAARVLDARQARPALDPRVDRAGRRGHPPARRAARRLALGRRRASRDEALVEGAVADAALPGVATAELVRRRPRERRARAGARSLARRCPLRPRRPGGRRAPRRRGVVRRGRRRGRAAARGRHPRRGRRAALRRRREPRQPAGRARRRASTASRSSTSRRRPSRRT